MSTNNEELLEVITKLSKKIDEIEEKIDNKLDKIIMLLQEKKNN